MIVKIWFYCSVSGKKQDAVFEASSSNDHTAPQDQFASPNDVDNNLPSSKKLKPHCESSTSVCYICWLSALPGKFFVKKALELGVPKGPLFGDLQAGNTITLDDGQQVVTVWSATQKFGIRQVEGANFHLKKIMKLADILRISPSKRRG